MATSSTENRPELTPTIQKALDSLRARVRAYVWAEGLAVAAAWLGFAFWASLAIDWFFEPPTAIRAAILLLTAVVFAGVLLRLIGLRAFVRLSDRSMATVLERRFSKFDDSLLTAVVLTGEHPDADKCNPEMLAHTCREAHERMAGIPLRDVFNPAPLGRAVAAAVLLAAAIGLFACVAPDSLGIWTGRNLMLSDDPWPRQSRLEIVGFKDGVAKVARGGDAKIVVLADTAFPRIPQVVEIRYRSEGGPRNRISMSREGNAAPGKDPFQEYTHTFQDILAPINFDIVDTGPSGDRIRDFRIEVVESPKIAEMTLHCKYPAYMNRADRTLPMTGVMQIPLGTRITAHGKANKELRRVQIDVTRGERTLPVQYIEAEKLDADRLEFQCDFEPLEGDATVLFTLHDADGIRSREAVRLVLAAIPDEPPQLAVRLDGIGSAVTPEARLPLVGQITDDYGIDRLWVETAVDQGEPTSHPLHDYPNHPSVQELTNVGLECRELNVKPGQKLLVGAKASDLCDIGAKRPNVGLTERWLLEVVTPERLRSMLEARELVLRQRFESILTEVTETRDLLLKVNFSASANRPAAGGNGAPKAGTAAGAEPGDAPREDEKSLPPAQRLERQTLRVQQALQNSRKNEHEVLGVAESFDDIRKQLVNNRIDTEELKNRLDGGIAQPLHRIAEDMFPALARRLERLQETVSDPDRGPQDRELARKKADEIILAMRHVLDRMIELEDFNEAVEILRSIIKRQQQLDEKTKQHHKETIRSLTED